MKSLEYTSKSDGMKYINTLSNTIVVYSFGIILWEIYTRERAFAEFNFRFMSQLEDQIIKGLRPYVIHC
jgi:hypothetical protein